jgi:hypothetical protein
MMLLALVGMVQAGITTTLTQTVSPASGTQFGYAVPTFTCYYFYYQNNQSVTVPGAYMAVEIDGKFYFATYSPNGVSTGYIYSGATLSAGTHTWYCNASASGYQPQIGPTQTYTVNSCPAQYCSGNNLCTYSGLNCTAKCSACSSGYSCISGTCALNRGGGGSPLLVKTPISGQAEQIPVQQTGNTWSFAVIILVIIGLGLAYFIARDYMTAAPAGRKRR